MWCHRIRSDGSSMLTLRGSPQACLTLTLTLTLIGWEAGPKAEEGDSRGPSVYRGGLKFQALTLTLTLTLT